MQSRIAVIVEDALQPLLVPAPLPPVAPERRRPEQEDRQNAAEDLERIVVEIRKNRPIVDARCVCCTKYASVTSGPM